MAKRQLCPTRYLDANPSCKSVRLGGRYIHIFNMAEGENLDRGYLSNVLVGKRLPSIPYSQRIAKALGLVNEDGDPDITRLFALISERKAEMDREYHRRLA